jgi:hypothetical protein
LNASVDADAELHAPRLLERRNALRPGLLDGEGACDPLITLANSARMPSPAVVDDALDERTTSGSSTA